MEIITNLWIFRCLSLKLIINYIKYKTSTTFPSIKIYSTVPESIKIILMPYSELLQNINLQLKHKFNKFN